MEAQQKPPIRLLWFSFVGAVAFYILVGYLSLAQNEKAATLDPGDLKDGLFLGAAVISLALTIFARSYLPGLLKAGEGKTVAVELLQFGFSELPGIFGLILFFLNGSFAQLVFLCLVALMSLAMLYPQE